MHQAEQDPDPGEHKQGCEPGLEVDESIEEAREQEVEGAQAKDRDRLEENTMNGSVVTANTAGIESRANMMSVVSTATSTASRGVAMPPAAPARAPHGRRSPGITVVALPTGGDRLAVRGGDPRPRRTDPARPAATLGVNQALELAAVKEDAAAVLALLEGEPAPVIVPQPP